MRLELPPRARRIPSPRMRGKHPCGTTSACAENTDCLYECRRQGGNYLRVRGEYCFRWYAEHGGEELPPRARRILTGVGDDRDHPGTTSACAENTKSAPTPPLLTRNYLRVRGEYFSTRITFTIAWELPPRARRIRNGGRRTSGSHGTTSAHAENTCAPHLREVT